MKAPYLLFLITIALAPIALELPASPGRTPPELSRMLGVLEKYLDDQATTASRVEIMAILPTVYIDPPPTAQQFPLKANLKISLDVLTGAKYLERTIALSRRTEWTPKETRGFPRWAWRVSDGRGASVFELLIDEENSAVCVGKDWYYVDRALIVHLTREFVTLATADFVSPQTTRRGTNGDRL